MSDTVDPFMKRYRNEIFVCLFLILATLAVFAQIRNHAFITYDDPAYVTRNQEVQAGWTWKSFIWAFTDTVQGHWHPLTLLSHITDCQLFGLNPAGHHLSSLFFHLLNILLLFFVLKTMTGALMRSAFVAALFALHPFHVEPVAWVADRKDILAALFWLLGMMAYFSYSKRPGLWRYVLVLCIFSFGLMSKAVVVTLPAVFFLLDYWPLNRLATTINQKKGHDEKARSQLLPSLKKIFARLVIEKIPFFILAGAFTLITAWVMQTAVTQRVAAPEIMASANYIAQSLVFYVTYIAKMFWPAALALPYPRPGDVPGWQATGAAGILIAVTLFVFWKGRRYPYLPIGWLWYLLTLAPVIGIAKFGPHELADRYTYIPLIGLFIMLSWGVPDLVRKLPHRNVILGILGGAVIGVLMVCSWVQTSYWKDNISLFRHTVSVTEDNFQAENDLGVSLKEQGKLDEAVKHLREAVRISPDRPRSQHNLGVALAKQGKLFEAILHLSKAVELMPDHMKAHHNLGIALARLGKIDEATIQFKEALRIDPNYAAAHNHLGAALASRGKLDQAIAEFKEALRLRPGYKQAERNLHHALALKRRSRKP